MSLQESLSEFQSLFWWISLLGDGKGFRPAAAGSVSILVLVDLAPRHPSGPLKAPPRLMFQSLFWWISLLGPRPDPQGPLRSRGVSILVLVDLAPRRPSRVLLLQGIVHGFNPCFGGSRSSACPRCLATGQGQEFQSLFWWISLLGAVRLGVSLPPHRVELQVSILVLVDLAPRAPCADRCTQSSRFQSLFWWISLLGEDPDSVRGGRRQPVSILVLVDLAPRLAVEAADMLLIALVSILVLVDLAPRHYSAWIKLGCDRFQSLFWWISLLGCEPGPSPGCPSCFNPCFGGSRSSAKPMEKGAAIRVGVSILVLVDLAPRPEMFEIVGRRGY